MTTSPKTFSLYKPQESERVPKSTLAYFQSRNKHRVYDLVIGHFIASGISQSALARRLGKGTDQISRWLGAPGNWTLDTFSDLLFAIDGAEPEYVLSFPLDKPKRNISQPEWSIETGPKIVLSSNVIHKDSNTASRFMQLTPVMD